MAFPRKGLHLPRLVGSKYVGLVVALVTLMVIHPYFAARSTFNQSALGIIMSLLLFSAIYATAVNRNHLLVGAILAVPVLVLNWVHLAVPDHEYVVAHAIAFLIFMGYATYVVLQEVFHPSEVTGDTLLGAVCAYLMIGFTFAMAYTALEMAAPGSIVGALEEDAVTRDALQLPHFVFFSFTTLTTLGYGDIRPVSDLARSLSMLEAVSGVLYTTILVARLVGMYGVNAIQKNGVAVRRNDNPEM